MKKMSGMSVLSKMFPSVKITRARYLGPNNAGIGGSLSIVAGNRLVGVALRGDKIPAADDDRHRVQGSVSLFYCNEGKKPTLSSLKIPFMVETGLRSFQLEIGRPEIHE